MLIWIYVCTDLDSGLHDFCVYYCHWICTDPVVSEKSDQGDIRDEEEDTGSGNVSATHEKRHGGHHRGIHDDSVGPNWFLLSGSVSIHVLCF